MDSSSSSLFNISNIVQFEISPEQIQNLCFRENLLVSKFHNEEEDVPVPVGGMCLDVQSVLVDKIVVYVSSKFDVNGATGGSKITAWLDSDCHTLEEKRMESLSGAEENPKQKLYVGIKKEYFHVRQQFQTDEKCDSRALEYPLSAIKHLICEGANFVLMRLLAQCCYIGTFEMSSLYINGDLCRNIYECYGVETGLVNNKRIMMCRIRRRIIEECGIIHECLTVLTSTGHLVKQEWKGCEYIIQMNPLQDPLLLTGCGCDTRLCIGSPWQDDIQLLSEYLDHHKLCEHKIHNFMKTETKLEDVLADYVKSLLQSKPAKVIEFTSDFFMRYATVPKKKL